MGSVGEVLPSRDSTRIVKHTFDVAKIGFIYYISKYFGRKNAIPTLFSNFSPFSFFISNLFLTFADEHGQMPQWRCLCDFCGLIIASAIYSEYRET